MENKYIRKITIPCYDTDALGRMKIFAFMNYAQEVANEHAEFMGFGYETLIKQRVVWILSRMHIHFDSYPQWKDKVELKTWHKGLDGLFFLRDFQLSSVADDKVLGCATTSWLNLNLDTRKLVRDPEFAREDTAIKEDVLKQPCEKLRIPRAYQMDYIREHEIVYSDIDFNGHANNAMYAFWAIDAIGNDYMLKHQISDFYINFNHEAKAGDKIAIFRHFDQEDGKPIAMIEGKIVDDPQEPLKGTSSFVVKCIFNSIN